MSNVETKPLILSNIVTDLTHSIKLFLILSHNIIKKHFLRLSKKKGKFFKTVITLKEKAVKSKALKVNRKV